jgi:ferredoxin
MRISVDRDLCQSHGRCAFVAPSIFSLDAELELSYEADPDESLRAEVEEAIGGCPEQAIREVSGISEPGGEQTPGR